MLVVCNGAPKSGSTWLYNILTELLVCEWPDSRYLTNSKKHPCIRPELLDEFIENEDFTSCNVISKNHLGEARYRNSLLSNKEIYVFDIERDPKDVTVSLYYDECNRNGFDGTFASFYWREGREQAAKLAAYHELWRSAGPRSYVTSYEKLKTDPIPEIIAIAAILGLDASESLAQEVHDKTSMDSLREKYSDQELYKGERFFRKGVVGDWENDFSPHLLRDIDKVMGRGIGAFDLHYNLNRIRRWFAWHFGK